MNFSSIAIEQRDKEVKDIKSFLTYSLIGSLLLHVAVLASGLGYLLSRVPGQEEPMELTIVEPNVQVTPLLLEKEKSIEEKVKPGDIQRIASS